MTRSAFLPVLFATAICALADAQITTDPNLDVTVVQSGLQPVATTMAADAFGNVYLMDATGITSIDSSGAVNPSHVVFTSQVPGALAYNPFDGYAYYSVGNPILGSGSSQVFRIDPAGGSTIWFGTNVPPGGLAIDNQSTFYLGTPAGIWSVTVNVPGFFIGANGVAAGLGMNAQLLALADGRLLVADGLQVDLVDPAAPGPGTPYFVYALQPGAAAAVAGLARSALNAYGVGAVIAVNEQDTASPTGRGYAFPGDLTTANGTIQFFLENYMTNVGNGVQAICSSKQNELFWYTNLPSPAGPGRTLYRVTQLPATTVPGSLFINAVAGGTVNVTVIGGAPGSVVQVGVIAGHFVVPQFYLPYACVELDPLNPIVIPLIDGFGVGGAPDGSLIDLTGTYTETFLVPPGVPPMLPISAQGFVLDSNAPNRLFYESNLVFGNLP